MPYFSRSINEKDRPDDMTLILNQSRISLRTFCHFHYSIKKSRSSSNYTIRCYPSTSFSERARLDRDLRGSRGRSSRTYVPPIPARFLEAIQTRDVRRADHWNDISHRLSSIVFDDPAKIALPEFLAITSVDP